MTGAGVEGDGTTGRWTRILNGVAAAIYVIGPDGLCSEINEPALALFGYTRNECIGKNLHTLLHGRRPDGSLYPEADCPLYQAREHAHPLLHMEEVFWTRDGNRLDVDCSSVPIADETGGVATVVTLTDLRTRRQMEEVLQATEAQQREVLRQRDAAARIEQELALEAMERQRELSRTVEEAAARELREQQAQQRRTEAVLVETDRLAAVGRLSASISHEINNPLEAVTNLLYLLQQEDSVLGVAREYVRLAAEQVARVSQIASQTLRFHRRSIGPVPVTAEQLLTPVLTLYQGRLQRAGIQIDYRLNDTRPVLCHDGEVRQVMNNLFSNAIEAMPHGGRIRVRAHNVSDGGVTGLRITISDNGTGMSEDLLRRIFDPFYTTKGAAGSGLGLWISSTIAQRHGGSLRVRSSQEPHRHGTTFCLYLPGVAESIAA